MATLLDLARHLKCPIDSRFTDSADSAIQVRPLQGASGSREVPSNPGYSQPVRVGPGAFRRTAEILARSPVVEEPSQTRAQALKPVAAAASGCSRGLRSLLNPEWNADLWSVLGR